MILAQTPFRVSFAGGGSDLPHFYRRHPGRVISTTIDKHIYIAIHPYFHDKIRIKYSRTEDVSTVDEIEHPLVRECLRLSKVARGMEIASFANVPAGTGLGSSSSFTVCLLHALEGLAGRAPSPEQLAAAACHVELERVGEPIGKQDQYAAAYGGLNSIEFHADGSVRVRPVACSLETREDLSRRLLLFYIGHERSASSILAEQARNMAAADKFVLVKRMVELAGELCGALERGQLDAFAHMLDEGWQLKSKLARQITNDAVDANYRLAREAGADGGKLLGAGGGGFLLLYCRPEKQSQLRQALAHLREMPFAMSAEGSRIVYHDGGHPDCHASTALNGAMQTNF